MRRGLGVRFFNFIYRAPNSPLRNLSPNPPPWACGPTNGGEENRCCSGLLGMTRGFCRVPVASLKEPGIGPGVPPEEEDDGSDELPECESSEGPLLSPLMPLLPLPFPAPLVPELPLLLSFMIPCLQCGQVSCSDSHADIHGPWNQCLHGNKVTSSPIFTSSMQILHSAFPSVPSISTVTIFFGRALIASCEAGPGALPAVFCSMSCEITRSMASCV